MIFHGGRSVVRLPRLSLQCGPTGPSSCHLQRVAALHNNSQLHNLLNIALRTSPPSSTSCRAYATRPVSRPKAHTGRTTAAARKAPTTSKTKAAKKPAAKKTTPKAIPSAKSTAKPKRKPAKAKAKPKTKPKKTSKRKVLTEAQKKAKTIKDLKEIALQPPRGIPSTAWMVFALEDIKGHKLGERKITTRMKDSSTEYKNLSPERLEHYNHIANQNKAKNENAYRQWIESHTPAVIHAANLARKNLKKRQVKGYTFQLHDHRQVKGLRNPYSYFFSERFASGDFKGLKVVEAARLSSREWKALSAAEKTPYEDSAKQDLARYTQERKTVFDKDVRRKPKAAEAA